MAEALDGAPVQLVRGGWDPYPPLSTGGPSSWFLILPHKTEILDEARVTTMPSSLEAVPL